MITPDDIKNPKRKSGFNHVGSASRSAAAQANQPNSSNEMWRAHGKRVPPPPGKQYAVDFRGPTRATAIEAAQDYCDYVNAQNVLTPADLENPDRKSGYDYVAFWPGGEGRCLDDRFRAQYQQITPHWYGPYRTTGTEAAQDYCDYVNALKNGVAPKVAPVKLNSAGHTGRRDPVEADDAEVQAALGVLKDHKAQRSGRQGYVYCIGEEGSSYAVKVGYSVKPEARVAELQTGNPRKLVLFSKREGTTADERALHEKYLTYNRVGEWFRPTEALLSEFNLIVAGGTIKPKEATA